MVGFVDGGFNEGDIVTVLTECSGAKPGLMYELVRNGHGDLITVLIGDKNRKQLCSCRNNFKLLKSSRNRYDNNLIANLSFKKINETI